MYIYICMYVCIYIYVCMCIHIYIYIYWPCSIELLNYLMVAPSEKGQHGDLTLKQKKYQKTL